MGNPQYVVLSSLMALFTQNQNHISNFHFSPEEGWKHYCQKGKHIETKGILSCLPSCEEILAKPETGFITIFVSHAFKHLVKSAVQGIGPSTVHNVQGQKILLK